MKLFEKYDFIRSGKTASNRIALAPMTNTQSNDDGTLGDDEYKWLVRRAEEGFGIITTCAAHVSADGQGWKGELGIFDDKHIEGLSRLAKGIRSCGSLAFVQIFHGGARSPQSLTGKQPWSASAHTIEGRKGEIKVRGAEESDIERVINDFVRAAERAAEAGFDGVELHGAHGYLLHQFLSSYTNNRSDIWGGSPRNRSRLIRTILAKIRSAVPDTFIVGIRLSPEDKYGFLGIDFEESLEWAGEFAKEGADFIHVSPWDSFRKPEKYPDGNKVIITYFRERVPKEVPVMVAGKIWSAKDAERVIEFGSDFVALGRAAIGIPDWPRRAKDIGFIPEMPPYTEEHLRNAGLGENFINYMRGWKEFVK